MLTDAQCRDAASLLIHLAIWSALLFGVWLFIDYQRRYVIAASIIDEGLKSLP